MRLTATAAAAITLLAIMLIAACTPQQPPPQPPSPPQATAECTADSDCGVGGCSGQVCTTAAKADGLITTCEYREEYGCLKLTSCGCANGMCAWQQNAEYAACVDKAKSPQPLLQ